MPRHVAVSPEEDVAAFYGGADPAAGGPRVTPEPGAPEFSSSGGSPSMEAAGPRPLKPVIRPMPPSLSQPQLPLDAPNSMAAAVLSFFLPGVGQLWLGQSGKGAAILAVALLTGCGAVSFGILNLIAAVDAYLLAERRAKGETIGPWQFF
jgi:TM2 domain-containing membrane protein YozV